MIGVVQQGPKSGHIANRQVMPQFPRSRAELEKLLGFAIVRAWGCQEASGNLVGLDSGAKQLQIGGAGASQYRKQMPNLQEFGICWGDGDKRWASTANDAAAGPGAASYFCAAYQAVTGTGANSVGNIFGLLDNADGAEYVNVCADYTGQKYFAQNNDDGANAPGLNTAVKSPRDKHPRGYGFMYDAGTGNMHQYLSGVGATSAPIGAWTGITGGTMGNPIMLFGSWPGGANTAGVARYGIWAYGAALNNLGVTLPAIMRRLGWH